MESPKIKRIYQGLSLTIYSSTKSSPSPIMNVYK